MIGLLIFASYAAFALLLGWTLAEAEAMLGSVRRAA